MRNLPDDCTVRLVDLPTAVGGSISETPDGHLNIYINARLSHDGRRRALDHELRHADRDDLHSAEPVADIEARADLPQLVKARDLQMSHGDRSLDSLQPPPPPDDLVPPPEEPPVSISPRQAHVLMNALSDLDRFLFRDDPYDDF